MHLMPESPITESQRSVITKALFNPKPFFGNGVWSFPSDQLNLFLAKDPFRIHLGKDAASNDDLQKLAAACDAATFGVDQKDVLDESYRKARKLDRRDFATNLDIVGTGLLKAVHSALFAWEEQPRSIRADLYKLNVYGPGSFFKSHKDTPRGNDMFGSLVLNFPTDHEGGALVLRHDGREHVHDASSAAYASPDQVSWVAFYSDVEHEVLPVKSGHRITLTYNLYFTDDKISGVPLPGTEPLLLAFQTVLKDKTFLPDGGRLGFGLKHQYPIPADIADLERKKQALQAVSRTLKGSDHAIFYTAGLLGLKPKLGMVYTDGYVGLYLLDHVYEGPQDQETAEHTGSWEYVMTDELGGERIGTFDDDDNERPLTVQWIVPRVSGTRVNSRYVYYGNEASMESIYGDLVMILTVPENDERQI